MVDYSLNEGWTEKIEQLSRVLQSRALLCVVVLLLVLKLGTVFVTINFPYNIFFADITERALENFANQARQQVGLQPLSENTKLDEAAKLKAENMIENGYFDHISPTGISAWHWFLSAGYDYKYAGENLAVGFFESEEVFNAWLNSPSHKANILDPNYKEIGTAVVGGFGPNKAIVVVQEFGLQRAQKTVAVAPVKPVKPVQIVPEKVTETPASVNEDKKVLSETSEKFKIEPFFGQSKNKASLNYEDLLQDVIYAVSSIVIGMLLLIIFTNINISFKKELIVRAVILLAILTLAASVNTEAVVSIIPHQINI